MGDRDAGVGRRGDAGGDAGDDLEGDAGLAQHLRLLAAAAEDERVAALEPHDAPARARVLDQQRVGLLLRDLRAAALLADVDQLGVVAGAGERRRPGSGGRRGSRRRARSARRARTVSSPGSPGPGADEVDDPRPLTPPSPRRPAAPRRRRRASARASARLAASERRSHLVASTIQRRAVGQPTNPRSCSVCARRAWTADRRVAVGAEDADRGALRLQAGERRGRAIAATAASAAASPARACSASAPWPAAGTNDRRVERDAGLVARPSRSSPARRARSRRPRPSAQLAQPRVDVAAQLARPRGPSRRRAAARARRSDAVPTRRPRAGVDRPRRSARRRVLARRGRDDRRPLGEVARARPWRSAPRGRSRRRPAPPRSCPPSATCRRAARRRRRRCAIDDELAAERARRPQPRLRERERAPAGADPHGVNAGAAGGPRRAAPPRPARRALVEPEQLAQDVHARVARSASSLLDPQRRLVQQPLGDRARRPPRRARGRARTAPPSGRRSRRARRRRSRRRARAARRSSA